MLEKDRLNILSIHEAVGKIFNYSKSYSNADDFYQNQRDFDAAMMNFIIIGEMVARLTEEFTEQNRNVDWFKIRGFRNIIAHNKFVNSDIEDPAMIYFCRTPDKTFTQLSSRNAHLLQKCN